MSGFIGGDQATHYAYGAARAIHAGEWDSFLALLDTALDDRVLTLADGQLRAEPSMGAFLDQLHQGAVQP